MWTCSKCGRIFKKTGQPHSCHSIPLREHFKHKETAEMIFNCLVRKVDTAVGTCRIISLPCCIHLFGTNDFLAALPKKNRLEIRFSLYRKLDNPRIDRCVPISTKEYKFCLDLTSREDVNDELMQWLKESYHLRESHDTFRRGG